MADRVAIDLEPLEGYGVVAGQRPPRATRDEFGRVTVLGAFERHQGVAQDAPACVLPAGWRPPLMTYVRSDSRPPGFVGEWDHDRYDSLQRFDPDGAASSWCDGEPNYAIFGAVFAT